MAAVTTVSGELPRLGELTDNAAADPTTGDREADAARIDQIALLDRIQAAAASTQAADDGGSAGPAKGRPELGQPSVRADPAVGDRREPRGVTAPAVDPRPPRRAPRAALGVRSAYGFG